MEGVREGGGEGGRGGVGGYNAMAETALNHQLKKLQRLYDPSGIAPNNQVKNGIY